MDFREKVFMAQEFINSLSGSPTEAIAIALMVGVNTNDQTIQKKSFVVGIMDSKFKVTIEKEGSVANE